MQVMLNIPDETPQEMISKMLMQFENQLQTAKQLVTKKEKPVPKFGSAKGLIKYVPPLGVFVMGFTHPTALFRHNYSRI